MQICFLLGLIVNEGINYVLKNIIQEPRPYYGKIKQKLIIITVYYFTLLTSFFY